MKGYGFPWKLIYHFHFKSFTPGVHFKSVGQVRPSITGADGVSNLFPTIYTSALHQLHQKSGCVFKSSFIPMFFHGWKKEIPNFLLKKKRHGNYGNLNMECLRNEDKILCIYIYVYSQRGLVIHIYTHTVNLDVNVEVELGKMLDIDRDKERNR